jgi:RNA methyltransferase, TrmH family
VTAGPELSAKSAPVSAARRLLKRAFRAADRRFLAEGPQAVREALAVPGVVSAVFATADAAGRHADLLATARAAGLEVRWVSGSVMETLAQTVTPQGVLAVCAFLDVPLDEILAARPPLVAVLAHVRDPGNAGTVLRAADAAGAEAVVVTRASVDLYNGKCVRASAGSLFHLPVSVGADVAAAVEGLRAAGAKVLAADGAGPADLAELDEAGALAGPTAWLFGNEAWGLPADLRELADAVVRVPIHGRAESLNLATAAAVCLYASARAQRRVGGCRYPGEGK